MTGRTRVRWSRETGSLHLWLQVHPLPLICTKTVLTHPSPTHFLMQLCNGQTYSEAWCMALTKEAVQAVILPLFRSRCCRCCVLLSQPPAVHPQRSSVLLSLPVPASEPKGRISSCSPCKTAERTVMENGFQ